MVRRWLLTLEAQDVLHGYVCRICDDHSGVDLGLSLHNFSLPDHHSTSVPAGPASGHIVTLLDLIWDLTCGPVFGFKNE